MNQERHWQRLKTDPEARERLKKRARVIAEIRDYFSTQLFLEVETPILVAKPGMEPNLDVFATELRDDRGRSLPGYLITSPEYAMKKLLAAGYERIYQITKCFRNGEPWGGTHNPEFTMVEWYRAQADYKDLMVDIENMTAYCAERVTGNTVIEWRGRFTEMAPPWPRMTVAEAMDQYADIDLDKAIDDPERFRHTVAVKGCQVNHGDTWDDLFFKIFLRDVEPRLGLHESGSTKPAQPVILYEYPRSMASLARLKPNDGRYAERFEAYCLGLELGNAFSELTDADEQRRRLKIEAEERRQAGKVPWEIDEQFLEAVAAMPESAGIAYGLDRLVMLLTDAPDIRDVLFFPINDMFSD